MRSAYGAKENRISEHPATIVVDVANVMGSRPDGWWRDRAGAAVRLHAEIAALAARAGPAAITAALAASGPGENEPPEFVMVLEGATRAAAARIDAAPARVRRAECGWYRRPGPAMTRSWPWCASCPAGASW